MAYRLLTNSEITKFLLRHPSYIFREGYVEDTVHGYVLVYEKADGTDLYIQTDSDPSQSDPSYWQHIADTFIDSVQEQTKNILTIGGISLSITAVIAAAVIIIYFLYVKK